MTVSSDSIGPPDVDTLKANRDINGLIKALEYQKDYHVREVAAEALGEIRDFRAVTPLIAALFKDKNVSVRKRVAEALGNLGDARAAKPLINAFKSNNDDEVRKATIEALGKIDKAYAIDLLIFELKGGSKTAAEVLEKMGWNPGPREIGVWYWIAKGDWEKCVKKWNPVGAADALGKIRNARAVNSLIVGLSFKPDIEVRDAIINALVKIGLPAVEPLIAVLKNNRAQVTIQGDDLMRCGAAEALGKIGDARAVDPLVAALSFMPETKMRETIVNALIRIGLPAVELLIAALKNKNWEVCMAAANVLGVIGDARAVDPLLAAIKHNEDYFTSAVEALGKIGDAQAIEPLIAVLKDVSIIRRKAAAEALKTLYYNGRVDQQAKNLILGMQSVMAFHGDTHDDQHRDETQNNTHTSSDCRHYDSHTHSHTDEGIGVTL